jgi:hypothetical protein
MIRHTFNLRLGRRLGRQRPRHRAPHAGPLNPDNHHVLEAMDHHFFTKHPAVQHVLNQYPEHFKGHEDQAIFPAFWLHWLTIPHHERLRGMPHEGFNGGTDHYPFWASASRTSSTSTGSRTTTRPSTSARTSARARTSATTCCPSAPRARCTRSTPSTARRPRLWAYYAHMLPALLSAEHAEHHWQEPSPEQVVRKFEAMSIELRKAVADLRKHDAMPAEPTPGSSSTARRSSRAKRLLGASATTSCTTTRRTTTFCRRRRDPTTSSSTSSAGRRSTRATTSSVTLPRGSRAAVVDSVEHAIPTTPSTRQQHALVHGIDLSQTTLHRRAPPRAAGNEADNLARLDDERRRQAPCT